MNWTSVTYNHGLKPNSNPYIDSYSIISGVLQDPVTSLLVGVEGAAHHISETSFSETANTKLFFENSSCPCSKCNLDSELSQTCLWHLRHVMSVLL